MNELLLVDDDATFRLVLRGALEAHDFHVREAGSVQEARECLKENVASHYLIDLKMPGSSGLELLEDIIKKKTDAKIVVITGHASIETAVNAVKLGATYYLSKPVTVAAIIAAFEQIAPSTEIDSSEEVKDLWELERSHIEATLKRNNLNVTKSAQELGLHRRTLQRKLIKLGLDSKSLSEGDDLPIK